MLTPVIHDLDSSPAEARGVLEGIQARFGFIPNLVGAMAEAPAVLKGYAALAEAFGNSTLAPDEQQVVALAVSRFHRCPYCVAGHTLLGEMAGIGAEALEAIRTGAAVPDPKLEALRRYTTRVVESRGQVTPEEVRVMLDAGFTPRQLMEVNLGVAFKTLSNFTHALLPVALDGPVAGHAWTPTPDTRIHVLVTGWLSTEGRHELGAYQSAAGPIMKRHGAVPILKSAAPGPLVGDTPQLVVLLTFPSAESARAAFDDPDYQPLLPLRDRVFTRLEVADLGAGG